VKNVREVGKAKERFVVITTSKEIDSDEDIKKRYREYDADIVLIDPVPIPPNVRISKNAWKLSWNKLHGFLLTQYSKLVHLDVDMLVNQRITELFGYPSFSSAPGQCSPCETNYGVNGGVMVYQPSEKMYVVSFIHSSVSLTNFFCVRYNDLLLLATQPHVTQWSGSEQNLVDEYFVKGRQTIDPPETAHLMSGLYNTAAHSCRYVVYLC
jgi:alpha-N-acetylglucosamine transferase